jgi:hypothetical protein
MQQLPTAATLPTIVKVPAKTVLQVIKHELLRATILVTTTKETPIVAMTTKEMPGAATEHTAKAIIETDNPTFMTETEMGKGAKIETQNGGEITITMPPVTEGMKDTTAVILIVNVVAGGTKRNSRAVVERL